MLPVTQAVYGYFIVVEAGSTDNDKFQPLLDGWRAYQEGVLAACNETTGRELIKHRHLQEPFDPYNLVDWDARYFYPGSLTTPPCTEDVWWNMVNVPIILSLDQGRELQDLILDYRDDNCEKGTQANPFDGHTSRPVQKLNGRAPVKYCADEIGPAPSGAVIVQWKSLVTAGLVFGVSLLGMVN